MLEKIEIEPRYKVNKTMLALILVVLVGISIFTLYKRGDLGNIKRLFIKNTNTKSVFEYAFDQNEKPTFETYNNNVLVITLNGIKAMDTKNKVVWEEKINIQKPIIKSFEKYLIVGEQGGKKIFFYQDNKKLWEKDLDGTITNLWINKNGYVLVDKQEEATNGEVMCFNPKGVNVFIKAYKQQDYLVKSDISFDNKKIAILTVSADKSRVSSKIEVFQLKKAVENNPAPIFTMAKDDFLSNDVKIFNNGYTVFTGDNKIIALDSLGREKWIKDTNELNAKKVNISSGNYIVVETNTIKKGNLLDNKNIEIQVYNADGVIEGEKIKVVSFINNIEVFDNYFIANDTSKLYSVSKGNLIWTYQTDKDIKYVKGFQGKNQILIVSKNSAQVIVAN